MTELSSVRKSTRSEVAQFLRQFASQLEQAEAVVGGHSTESGAEARVPGEDGSTPGPDGKVTMTVGNDSATINPPETVEFEVEVGEDDPLVSGETERHLEFGLTWDAESVVEDDSLEID